MRKLICKHCTHLWNYNGRKIEWTCCPKCKYKVKIPEIETNEVLGSVKKLTGFE